jgi:hypothetical protein
MGEKTIMLGGRGDYWVFRELIHISVLASEKDIHICM